MFCLLHHGSVNISHRLNVPARQMRCLLHGQFLSSAPTFCTTASKNGCSMNRGKKVRVFGLLNSVAQNNGMCCKL